MNSLEHAFKALRLLLLQRLVPHGNHQWIQSAIVTLIWMSTTEEEAMTLSTDLLTVLKDLSAMCSKQLDSEAAHGALVVQWLSAYR